MGNLRTCSVSFTDSAGIRHSAEVNAESLYEAAVLGIRAISEQWASEPAPLTTIQIRVNAPSVSHEVTLKQVRQWLDSTCSGPKERLVKDRLKSMLPG